MDQESPTNLFKDFTGILELLALKMNSPGRDGSDLSNIASPGHDNKAVQDEQEDDSLRDKPSIVTKTFSKPSHEKQVYHNIPNELRLKLITAVENNREKIKHAAQRLCINYSSAKSICQTYKREGRREKILLKRRSTKEHFLDSIDFMSQNTNLSKIDDLGTSKQDMNSMALSQATLQFPKDSLDQVLYSQENYLNIQNNQRDFNFFNGNSLQNEGSSLLMGIEQPQSFEEIQKHHRSGANLIPVQIGNLIASQTIPLYYSQTGCLFPKNSFIPFQQEQLPHHGLPSAFLQNNMRMPLIQFTHVNNTAKELAPQNLQFFVDGNQQGLNSGFNTFLSQSISQKSLQFYPLPYQSILNSQNGFQPINLNAQMVLYNPNLQLTIFPSLLHKGQMYSPPDDQIFSQNNQTSYISAQPQGNCHCEDPNLEANMNQSNNT